jgi:hydrogenase nickel incorporation protein HypB
MSSIIKIEKNILETNNIIAARNRERYSVNRIMAANIMSSPGAGKTTLLEKTIKHLSGKVTAGVIEGDIATDNDAKRIEKAGADWVVQINTEGTCHLDAHMIEKAIDRMPEGLQLLIIENVGNLVCPAGFDLGEDIRIMLASITEGIDKPKKYPHMYRECDALVINKIDLAPVLDVAPDSYEKEALVVNPSLKVFKTSATKGNGVKEWCDWLLSLIQIKQNNR